MKTHDDLLLFGRTVRALRKERGLSQEDLADLSGLHPNYVGGIERGERNLGIKNLLGLARALEVAPAALLDGYGVEEEAQG